MTLSVGNADGEGKPGQDARYPDRALDALKGGKLTLAVASFPITNWGPEHFIPTIDSLRV